MLTVFTPSFADEANTNAQNLTAKEVISRLPADRFQGHASWRRTAVSAEGMGVSSQTIIVTVGGLKPGTLG